MFLQNKKTAALLLAAAMTLGSLCGCGSETPQPVQQPQPAPQTNEQPQPAAPAETAQPEEVITETPEEPQQEAKPPRHGNPVSDCDTGWSYVYNNLETEDINVAENDSERSFYIRISGLADKKLENSINAKIAELFYSVYDPTGENLPPYVGIKVDPTVRNGEMNWYTCGVYVYANSDNILSLSCESSWTFEDYPSEYAPYRWISDCRTMNIDLNTGEEITLSDLLIDSVDGKEYVDAQIEAILADEDPFNEALWYDGTPTIPLASEFTGIREDQKFNYVESMGRIRVYFDYEDPEIRCDFSPLSVEIPLDGVKAVRQRFASEKKLYDSDEEKLRLRWNPFDEKQQHVDNGWVENGEFIDGDVSYWYDTQWNDEMSDGQIAYTQLGQDELDELRTRAQEMYDSYAAFTKVSGSASLSTSISRAGDFTRVDKWSGLYLNEEENWKTLYSSDETSVTCFRGDSGVPLGLNDVFRPEAEDMYDCIFRAFEANMWDAFNDGEVSHIRTGEDFQPIFEELMTHLAGFSVSADCLEFSYQPGTIDSICYQYFDVVPDDYWHYNYMYSHADFDDIGPANLNVFD